MINISQFLDVSKAFETIIYEILLSKQGKCGIIKNEHSWFTSYLNDRIATSGEITQRNRRSYAAYGKGHVWGLFYSFCRRMILERP